DVAATTTPDPEPCPACSARDVRTVPQRFRDGSVHLAGRCAACGRHLRWQAQATGPTRRMPFGKWKGTALLDCPPDYLEWLLRTRKIGPGLRADIGQALTLLRAPARPPTG